MLVTELVIIFFHFHPGNRSPKPAEDGGQAKGGPTAATSDSYCWKNDATWAVNTVQAQLQMSLFVELHVTYRCVRVFQVLHRVWSSAQSRVGAERVHWPVCSTEVKDVMRRLPPHLPSASLAMFRFLHRTDPMQFFLEQLQNFDFLSETSHWWASVCVWWLFHTKGLNIVSNLDPRWNYFIQKNLIYNTYLYRSTL